MNIEKDTHWHKISQEDFDKYIANDSLFIRKEFGNCLCYYMGNGARVASKFDDGDCFTKYLFWSVDAQSGERKRVQ